MSDFRMFMVAILVFVLMAGGCTVGEDDARRILREDGYTDIELTGWAPLSCSDADQFRSGFVANRRVLHEHGSGIVRVEGAVCCTLLYACTVRHSR